MIGCYIIYSQQLKRFYVGVLQEDLDARIQKHNNHSYGEHRFTAKANDWQLYLYIACDKFTEALFIEKKIKKMKSSKYIRNLKRYPEIIENLIQTSKEKRN